MCCCILSDDLVEEQEHLEEFVQMGGHADGLRIRLHLALNNARRKMEELGLLHLTVHYRRCEGVEEFQLMEPGGGPCKGARGLWKSL